MPSDSSQPFLSQPIPFDAAVLEQLACPGCLGGLLLKENQLVCTGCGRVYPIVNGIPVLIAGREDDPRS
jgi:uncharacterized protein